MLLIFKKIKQILSEFSSDYPFKIVEISGDPNNKNTRIAYQVSGKSTVVTDKPGKLVDELIVSDPPTPFLPDYLELT